MPDQNAAFFVLSFSDLLVIIAIILGPILAIQIQKAIERARETKQQKLNIFRTLMSTRATPTAFNHVEALNLIEVVFYKHKEVLDVRKSLMDNFDRYPRDQKSPTYGSDLKARAEESEKLIADLLQKMGNVLGFDFGTVDLKRSAYRPQSHADMDTELDFIRKGLVQTFFFRKTPLPVQITNLPD